MPEFEIKDNIPQVIDETDLAIERALEIIGGKLVRDAVMNTPVRTGLLSNSIVYAIDGKMPSLGYYKANEGDKDGYYDKEAPKEKDGVRSVMVGTNVVYGEYVEVGTNGRAGRYFIRDSLQNHIDEYNKILSNELKKVGK